MRQRALIHVFGPIGSGKTTLVRALLNNTDHVITVVRAVRDDQLTSPVEELDSGEGEEALLWEVGAQTARYRFPATDNADDLDAAEEAFFQTDVMQEFSHAVVIEGYCPTRYVDLSVFVAPAGAGRLLVRRKNDEPAKRRQAAAALAALLDQPGGVELFLDRMVGPIVASAARTNPDLLAQLRQQAVAELASAVQAPAGKAPMRWCVAEAYRGIQTSQLVVVNVRDQAEQASAVKLLAEVARLRKDEDVFNDVMRTVSNRIPITAVAANLSKPADPGTRKALARIRRTIQANS